MGKGNYRSDSVAESVMFWTTDLGFDVDISEFVRSEEQKICFGKTKCYYHSATVTFKDYSYVLETSHYNMNILAEDIKKHLISINHPEFEYLIKDYNIMSESFFNETFQKFGSTLSREKTLYNPSKNEYKFHYSLLKFKSNQRKDIVYTHVGEFSEYIPGSFYTHIRNLAKNNQIDNIYPVEISGVANKLKIVAKKILEKNGNTSLKLQLFFNITEEKYYLEFVTNTDKKEFVTSDFDPDPESIKLFLHENFPEYLI